MSGFENWVPLAVLASMIPFVKARPEQILRSMIAVWLRPEDAGQKTADDQFGEAKVWGAAHGATIRRVPLNDPYWQQYGVNAADYQPAAGG